MEETKEERVEYKIYKIVCNETGKVYFGKTTRSLEYRLWHHKYHLTCTSRQIIERGKYYIEQIDSTFDEDESIILERRYIENNECVNERIPGRTVKEYHEEHKEEISEYMKKYYEAHKEELSEYHKEWREKHKEEISKKKKIKYTCECGSTLRIEDKARHQKSQKHINFVNLNNNNI